MLNANADCKIEPVTGFNEYGEPTFGQAVPERCAVLRLRKKMARTTVRADSSSSRGHGDERLDDSKVLLQGDTVAELGDRLTIAGAQLRILSMHERWDVNGYVDHYETVCELWA